MVQPTSRRKFLTVGGMLGGTLLVHSSGLYAADDKDKKDEAEVTPGEDLMHEHGLLKRCLLIYREGLHRLESKSELQPKLIRDTAQIICTFIEEYHEKQEEEDIFPRFRKANKLIELVDVLEKQHKSGRVQTEMTLRYANDKSLKDADERTKLAKSMQAFIRMYEPHEAREDTVLFPAMLEIMSGHEYSALGEEFEKREHKMFGKDGFEEYLDKIEAIEKTLGIYDLAQFTPA
jgi:hemerythrin-like domain-containing protein